MTSHNKAECRHCGTPYWFQASGSGWGRKDHKDSTYCQSCRRVIDEALKAIPRKCERRWIDSKEYTLEELQAFEREHEERARQSIGILTRRVLPCLFDLSDGDNNHIVRCVETPSGTFSYSYWTKNALTKPSITKEVHWDIINDRVVEAVQSAEIME